MRRARRPKVLLVAAGILVPAVLASPAPIREPDIVWAPWPRVSWTRARPESQGFDSRYLDGLGDRAVQEHPRLTAIVVVRHGYLVWERAFHGGSLTKSAPVDAITSSVVSALVGWAVDRRRLSEKTTVGEIFADYFRHFPDLAVESRRRISVGDLLSMTSGLVWDARLTRALFAPPTPTPPPKSSRHKPPHKPPPPKTPKSAARSHTSGEWHPARWTREILSLEPAVSRGQRFFRGDAGWPAQLLSEAMARRTGRTLEPLARDVLFGPLGIDAEPWERDPDGFEIVPFGLSIAPRDLARFGYLYLRDGVWDGRRIVSEAWLSKSTARRSDGGPPENCPYGYLWWTTDETRHHAFFAAGFGGQYVYVVPDLALVVVTTAGMAGEEDPKDDVRAVIREIVRAAR